MRNKDTIKGTSVNSHNVCIGRSKMVEMVEKFKNGRRKATKAVVFRYGGKGREVVGGVTHKQAVSTEGLIAVVLRAKAHRGERREAPATGQQFLSVVECVRR